MCVYCTSHAGLLRGLGKSGSRSRSQSLDGTEGMSSKKAGKIDQALLIEDVFSVCLFFWFLCLLTCKYVCSELLVFIFF